MIKKRIKNVTITMSQTEENKLILTIYFIDGSCYWEWERVTECTEFLLAPGESLQDLRGEDLYMCDVNSSPNGVFSGGKISLNGETFFS